MAKKLVFSYVDSSGGTKTISFSNIANDLENTDVQALAAGLVTNGSIYASPPATIKSAKTVVTTENNIPLS